MKLIKISRIYSYCSASRHQIKYSAFFSKSQLFISVGSVFGWDSDNLKVIGLREHNSFKDHSWSGKQIGRDAEKQTMFDKKIETTSTFILLLNQTAWAITSIKLYFLGGHADIGHWACTYFLVLLETNCILNLDIHPSLKSAIHK